jgi:hypothetical protein
MASSSQSGSAPDTREVLFVFLGSQRAKMEVADRVQKRLLAVSRQCGLSQREMATSLDRPQTWVHRALKAIDEDPSALALTPIEIYQHYEAGELPRTACIDLLTAFPYESGHAADDDPTWGYARGTWDDLAQLAVNGKITDAELQEIVSGSASLDDQYV